MSVKFSMSIVSKHEKKKLSHVVRSVYFLAHFDCLSPSSLSSSPESKAGRESKLGSWSKSEAELPVASL